MDDFQERLQKDMRRLLERKNQQLTQAGGRLQALSPLNVLTRGYSLTQKPSGELLRDANQVRIGDSIISRLHSGRIESIVTAIPEPE